MTLVDLTSSTQSAQSSRTWRSRFVIIIVIVDVNTLAIRLHEHTRNIWQDKQIPPYLRNVNITTINKRDIHHTLGLSRHSIAWTIFALIFFNHLLLLTEEILHKIQCDLKPSRGTTDVIFGAQTIQGYVGNKSRDYTWF